MEWRRDSVNDVIREQLRFIGFLNCGAKLLIPFFSTLTLQCPRLLLQKNLYEIEYRMNSMSFSRLGLGEVEDERP